MDITFETGSIRQTHQRLVTEGYRVRENSLRMWVKSGALPAAYCGKKAYIYYPNALKLLENGTGNMVDRKDNGIRKVG